MRFGVQDMFIRRQSVTVPNDKDFLSIKLLRMALLIVYADNIAGIIVHKDMMALMNLKYPNDFKCEI